MKLKILSTQSRGYRVVKCVAIINQPKRRQKTFTVRTVAPDLAAEELQKSFAAEAGRWEVKTLEKLKQENTP